MDLNNLISNPEQLKQLISALQAILDKNNNPGSEEEDQTQQEIDEPNSSIKTKNSKQRPQKTNTNKFLSMPEMNMHKDDAEIDKKLAKHPPVMRAREFETIRVVCRVCGKEENISPSIVESVSRYKCNKCSTSAG